MGIVLLFLPFSPPNVVPTRHASGLNNSKSVKTCIEYIFEIIFVVWGSVCLFLISCRGIGGT